MLLLIPQRYEFSSKSQHYTQSKWTVLCCCWYHKGTNFQANHNIKDVPKMKKRLLLIPQRYEFSSKSQQVHYLPSWPKGCCWYHKGTNFQANHNFSTRRKCRKCVVADTTKVRIFKQITTAGSYGGKEYALLLIPQRYEFSSKSQLRRMNYFSIISCCWYHKGTNFQANHNTLQVLRLLVLVVADTTKVRIFKQLTT